MDNLGILKAIVGALSNSNTTQTTKSGEKTGAQPFDFGKILQAFKNFTQNNSKQNNAPSNSSSDGLPTQTSQGQTPQSPPKTLTPPPPLQSGMLAVMTDHDKFVKRVLEKAPSPK